MLKNFSIYSFLYLFFHNVKMATIANKSYLKRMFNDTQQAGAGLRINMNETLDDIFVVICDIHIYIFL